MIPAVIEIQCFHNAGSRPADRVAKADHPWYIDHIMCYEIKVGLADGHKTDKHNNHWCPGISMSAQCSGQYVVYRIEQEEKGIDMKEYSPGTDNFRIGSKQPYRKIGKNEEEDCNHEIDQYRHAYGNFCSERRPFLISRADILAYERGGCHGKASDRKHDELVNLIIASPSGHDRRLKMVDIRLHKDIGKCRNDGLDSRRQTNRKNIS